MKTLNLYIDKWYIIGAICTDGISTLITPPNGDDRFWLFFYEDLANNEIIYGKDNQSHFRDGEIHYIGNVFKDIINPRCRFSRYEGRFEEMKGIFYASGIFDVLKEPFKGEKNIDTYITFSSDIEGVARLEFLNEINEHFHVIRSDARIGYLSLEHNFRKDLLTEEGYYLVMNACNEELHYMLYRNISNPLTSSGENHFEFVSEDVLKGMGLDLRSRALVETVVDDLNKRTHFLNTAEEKDSEYLRMNQFVPDWLNRITKAKTGLPITIPNLSLANHTANVFSVTIIKKKLDERTSVIVKDIIRVITDFVRSSGIRNEEIKGLVFIGNTFTNDQFERAIREKIFVADNNLIRHKESELPNIMNVYPLIGEIDDIGLPGSNELDKAKKEAEYNASLKELVDLISKRDWESALTKLKKMLNIYIDKVSDLSKYKGQILSGREEDNKVVIRNYKVAMSNVLKYESEEQYENMKEWCENALSHKPGDSEATQKLNDAIRLIAEETATAKQYNAIIQKAFFSFNEKRWNEALSQSEAALEVRPNSVEAKRISNDARRNLGNLERINNAINRVDMFIEEGHYARAMEELSIIKNLDSSFSGAKEREAKIQDLLSKRDSEIKELNEELEMAISNKKYDSAKSICSELMNLDTENSPKWQRKRDEIETIQVRFAAEIEKWDKLMSDIDDAKLNENWSKLSELCKSALKIDAANSAIKELLCIAEAKIKCQFISESIERAAEAMQNSLYSKAISILEDAQKVDPANEQLESLMIRYRDKANILREKVESLINEMRNKEQVFVYKEAIELCKRIINIDVEHRGNWQEEIQRLQSLQIEKDGLELNWRRKKADLKYLVREGHIDSEAEQKILTLQKKFHDFGIDSHNQEFLELLIKANPDKYQKKEKTATATTDKRKRKNSDTKPRDRAKQETITKQSNRSINKTISDRTSDVLQDTSSKQISQSKTSTKQMVDSEQSTEQRTRHVSIQAESEGLRLLREGNYRAAKRKFATTEKNPEMSSLCTRLIELEKNLKAGTITPKDRTELEKNYKTYNIKH